MEGLPVTPQLEVTIMEPTLPATHKLNKWIFGRGQPFAKGRILEIGKGEGCVAKYCRQEGLQTEVLTFSIGDESFSTPPAHLFQAFDMVFILHEGKQLANRNTILANSAMLLKKDGYLLTLLPGNIALYQGLDQGLDEWKLYNWKYVKGKIKAYYDLVKIRYFIIGNNIHVEAQQKSRYYERVMIFDKGESVDFDMTGLSILIVGKKR